MAQIRECCLKTYRWGASPKGKEDKLDGKDTYVTGSNPDVAVLIIHNIHGWTYTNTRVLADHYADEIDATVYIPDFFGGEVLPAEIVSDRSRWKELDIQGFAKRNSKETRSDEILESAKALRGKYKRVGVMGFCFGGWGAFRIGAKGNNLVECIATCHPSFLTREEMQNVGVPVQVHAPEIDEMFTPDLKEFCNKTIPELKLPYDYQYYPGLEHGFAIRGDPNFGADMIERKGMERAKNAAVLWFRQWLYHA